MQRKAMYYGEQNHVGIGYVLKNMMTIGMKSIMY